MKWWPNRPSQHQEAPTRLDGLRLTDLTVEAIFGDYHANFRHFETWRIRKRSQIIADRYASNQQMIYRSLAKPRAAEVDQLQQTYHYTVLAHEVDTGLTHLDKAVAHDPPEAGWELEGETVQVAEVEDDVVQLNSTSEPQPGTTITSTRTISEEGQLQETFQSEWHLPADLWERAIAFGQNFLPKGNLADRCGVESCAAQAQAHGG